jgi:hypothetical protein
MVQIEGIIFLFLPAGREGGVKAPSFLTGFTTIPIKQIYAMSKKI